MYQSDFFLGLPITSFLSKGLDLVDPARLAFFIQKNNDTYLQELYHEETPYLGKYAGKMSDLVSLQLLQNNIYSLLRQIIPDYSYDEIPLVLFPTLKPIDITNES